LNEYSIEYDPTQSYSGTFNTFHRRLAQQLIDKYDLHHKRIIEIGCGQGEFLTLLCELGENQGVGFDPAYVGNGSTRKQEGRLTFIQDFYSDKYANYQGDFICCKMTLEHIPQTADFVRMVRQAIETQTETIIFFQVPDMVRILREVAFWDIYYEHCSYFSAASLARLFLRCGFEILHLTSDYNGQYLMIEAGLNSTINNTPSDMGNDLNTLRQDVTDFAQRCPLQVKAWQHKLYEFAQHNRRVVIWGGGSKGVAFLTTVGLHSEIEFVVDINPRKHNTFIAGTGQEIVGPEFLKEYKPEVVIVMNPIYCTEIQQELDRLGVKAELLPVV